MPKRITTFNKDNKVFDSDYKSQNQLIDDLKRKVSSPERDNEILKKISLLAKKE